MRLWKTIRSGSLPRVLLPAAALGLVFAAPDAAEAFEIYNTTGITVSARVNEGDFRESVAAGDHEGCHWTNTDCNPSGGREAMLTAQIETETFNCTVRLQAGGYAQIEQEDRSSLGLPPNYYCRSYDYNHVLVDYTDYNFGLNPATRDVHFLVTADPQYDNRAYSFYPIELEWKITPDLTLGTMVNMLTHDRSIRGMIVAGDLTANTRPNDELASYHAALNGFSRFALRIESIAPRPTLRMAPSPKRIRFSPTTVNL